MLKIKKYLFHDLKQQELPHLFKLYNKKTKQTTTWLDKDEVTLEDFSDQVEVETIYIAYEEEKMVGFLTFYVPDNFIHLFFVDATSQGSGIGSKLLAEIVSDFEGEEISLKCLIHNNAAISFYERKGFTIVETHELEKNQGYHLMKK
jgi:ribosomal protein S18 acetylase RimI-like enzyme